MVGYLLMVMLGVAILVTTCTLITRSVEQLPPPNIPAQTSR